jgi:DNA-binding MarR family transcriptional regulator
MTSDRKSDPVVPYLPSIGRMLSFAMRSCSDLSEQRLAEHDLTLPQWVLLTALWRGDGLTVGELAAYCRSTEPTTSNLIARMEAKGLLERRHGVEDRRQVRIHLTRKAKALSGLIDFYNEINDAVLSDFTEKEKKAFVSMLERATANAQAAKKSQS